MMVGGKVGPSILSDTASETPIRLGRTGAQVVTDAHARYWEAVKRGNCYRLILAAAAATAYSGAAAGTPVFSLQNPATSGKDACILGVGIASTTAASAAGTVAFSLFGAPSGSTLNAASLVSPTNAYSQAAGGSVIQATINTALTASSGAATLAMPVASYYWATAAAAFIAPTFFDVAGMVTAAPGQIVTFGASAALTSAAYSFSILWEEIPV